LNLILILKELWHRRLFVAATVFAAAALAVLAVFQVSLLPPSIAKRADSEARGSIAILIDSARSPIADARRDLTGLTARAGVFARYMAGGNVIEQIAKANDIPIGRIDVSGPVPLPGEAPGIEGGPSHPNPFGISVTQQGELPVVVVDTRAPTARQARGLAAAAPGAITRVVRSIQEQQGTPLERRVEFRVLGPAEVTVVNDPLGRKVAALLFLFLLAMFLGAILGVPRFRAAWRTAGADHPLEGPDEEPAPAAEILLVPGGKGGAPKTEVSAAEAVRQRGDA
jgi:hypothetical protein